MPGIGPVTTATLRELGLEPTVQSRRAFNISSLSVGPTTDERVSRMTIVVDGASTPVDQVHKQLEKLVRVLKVVELEENAAVERELALIKVSVQPDLRTQLLDIAAAFRAGRSTVLVTQRELMNMPARA